MAASGKPALVEVATTAFGPELELLLRIAGEAITGEPAANHLQAEPAWDRLLQLAELHGLEPFLLRWIRRARVSAPVEFSERLSRNCAEIAGRNLALGKELVQVSRELGAQGIEHLVYKGPLLAQMLYGSLALRPSRDIDLIVRPEQAKQAFAALEKIGYVEKDNLSARQRSAMIRFASEQCLARERIEVDLHWRLAPAATMRRVDVDAIWRRAVPMRLFDAELPAPAPEDLFLALCLHAGEHAWSQLSLFCDLGRLLEVTPGFDWEILRSQVRDANTRRTLDVTLLLLANCFGVSVPQKMLRREMQVELLAARVARDFWPDPEQAAHKETSLAWFRERSRGERLPDRLRWITGGILTPTLADFQWLPLPEFLQFSYRAVRVVRLALRGVGLTR